jgi:hypothetical protein
MMVDDIYTPLDMSDRNTVVQRRLNDEDIAFGIIHEPITRALRMMRAALLNMNQRLFIPDEWAVSSVFLF